MTNKRTYVALDVGAARIGVAVGDSIGRIAQPVATIVADGEEIYAIRKLLQDYDATDLVFGLPRNQAGSETQQTAYVKNFAAKFNEFSYAQHWQDESVTSVLAEERLRQRKKPYTKADIDAEAAAIFLQDFLEEKL